MRGVILAGGTGSRLAPMTNVTNKHLLPVYDKPMIYYPINTLVKAGIKDIIIITGQENAGDFLNLLSDGKEFGANFTYRIQRGTGGIAAALKLAKDFTRDESFIVMLGDNILQDDIKDFIQSFIANANINNAFVFLKSVDDPEKFGVATIEGNEIKKIVEKTKQPETDLAVIGLYVYSSLVWGIIDELVPSPRGELEITDVNNWFIEKGLMRYEKVKGFWSDAGSIESLHRASAFMRLNKDK